jgi:AbrB family transcriptional regulator, stage V sporulation protein T
MSYHAKLIKGGKIVIPAELRREFGFEEGDYLVFEKEGDRLVLKSREALLCDIRAKVKAGLKRPLTVDDYLREKWAEADSE